MVKGMGLKLGLNKKRGSGIEVAITASVSPGGQLLVGENASADLANFATFDSTGNYSSTAGTISSVDYQIDGVSNAGDGVLADGDAPSFLVTDSVGNTRPFSLPPVVYTAPVAAGGLADQAFAQNGGFQTFDASTDFTGSNITYSMNSVSDVAINSGSGVITFDTDSLAEQTGTVVTVTGTNSGGSDTSAFSFDVAAFSVSQTDDGIDLDGATGTVSVAVTSPAAYTSGTKGGAAASSPFSVDTTALSSGPVEIVSPSVTGTLETGNALTAQVPLFFYNAASLPTPTYQWERDTGSGYADISGATSLVLSALDNDTGGDVRLKASVTDDNGTTVITTGASTVAGGFVSINDSLFGASEYGFFIDTTDSTEFYANENLTGAAPPVAPADIESIRDASPNSIVIQKNGGVPNASTGPLWDTTAGAMALNSDNIQAELNSANLTTTMTLMFSCQKDGYNENITNILFGRGGTTADWFLNFRTVGASFGSGSTGTPSVYVDGVLTATNTSGWLTDIMNDNAVHLFEVRNLDLSTLDWSLLNIGSREQTPVQGILVDSIVLTSNNTASDIEEARQFWVDNHGVTLA